MSGPEPDPPGGFCVVCGRTDVPFVDAVCADCFAKRHALVTAPARAVVVLCPTCGARLVGNHWERSGTSTMLTQEDLLPLLTPLEEVGIRRVEWEESGRNPLLREMKAEVHARFRGTERTLSLEFPVHIEHRSCPECSRRSGHYYTALIQLRGPEGRAVGRRHDERPRLHRLWDRAIPDARPEWRAALSWEEARPEGWDFYLVDTVSARSLARWLKARWGAQLTESPSLYGRKDGRDLYRVTFCLRVAREGSGAERAPAARRPVRRSRATAGRAGRRFERQP